MLQFAVEFDHPIIDQSAGTPTARIDARLFFLSPDPPPNWDGLLETVNWEEELIEGFSVTDSLHNWLGQDGDRRGPAWRQMFSWMINKLEDMATSLGQDSPIYRGADPDDDNIVSWLDEQQAQRGFYDVIDALDNAYAEFAKGSFPPPVSVTEKQGTVDEELAELEESLADDGEVTEPGTLGGSTSKDAIDLTGVDVPDGQHYQFTATLSDSEGRGVFCDNINEAVPKYISAPCERVIRKKVFPGNAWIVIGRDRPASRASGYGGAGDTQASSIDIVVGRMGSQPRSVDIKGQPVSVDPDFKNDAARIYISQKSDIDNYFGLPAGKIGNSTTRSGIALKADGIRLVAREGIKLVTGTDATNSQGPLIRGSYGIDLIANNDDKDLQPIPKGRYLTDALSELAELVANLAGIVDGILKAQMKFNKELTTHTHRSPFYALDTTPSIPLIPKGVKCTLDLTVKSKKDIYMFKTNIENFKMDYLMDFGANYINSKYNNTN